MEINFDIKGIGQVEALLNEHEINKAISRALNRAARAGFVAGSRKIREEYNIKAGDIKKSAKTDKATYGNLQARIRISGERIPLKYFGARQTKKGVTVKIKKSEGRVLIEHAFIGGYTRKRVDGRLKMVKASDWGKGHVFIRKPGKGRMPFRMSTEHMNIPDLFSMKPVSEAVVERINEVFEKEFWHDYEFYLSRKK